MSSILPPLDVIPKLPGQAASIVMSQLDKQLDVIATSVTKTVQDSIKLPADVTCNDPRIQQLKTQLSDIQQQLTAVQSNIPKIQQTIDTIKTAVTVAQSVRTAITVAQLSNPVTAPVFIAQNLMAIQDTLIVNSISALQSFSTIPTMLQTKLQTIVPPLSDAIKNISSACNGNIDNLVVPGFDDTTDYNDLIPTQFYIEQNVSDEDLQDRSDAIQQLIEQQRNLMNSLLEAPSQVYKQSGIPSNELGKPGDYYIDIDTNIIYGPKMDVWRQAVN